MQAALTCACCLCCCDGRAGSRDLRRTRAVLVAVAEQQEHATRGVKLARKRLVLAVKELTAVIGNEWAQLISWKPGSATGIVAGVREERGCPVPVGGRAGCKRPLTLVHHCKCRQRQQRTLHPWRRRSEATSPKTRKSNNPPSYCQDESCGIPAAAHVWKVHASLRLRRMRLAFAFDLVRPAIAWKLGV
jgi:hypothetical protein